MDLMALISRHLIMPLFIIVRGGITNLPFECHLSRSQYFSEEQIRSRQWRRLQRLLRYVYKHNRFYRARFDNEGIIPDDIKSFADFSRLPPLTKDDIRNNLEALISDEFDKSKSRASPHWGLDGGTAAVILGPRGTGTEGGSHSPS